jgi:hypothetical protein
MMIFGLVRFLIKRSNQIEIYFLKKTETGSNRFGSVWLVFFRFGLVFFRFHTYKTEIEPNQLFFQNFNRFFFTVWFFRLLIFWFFWFFCSPLVLSQLLLLFFRAHWHFLALVYLKVICEIALHSWMMICVSRS